MKLLVLCSCLFLFVSVCPDVALLSCFVLEKKNSFLFQTFLFDVV